MFEAFPKIPRLRRGCVITEKIDGTNAQIHIIDAQGSMPEGFALASAASQAVAVIENLWIYAGSRSRYLDVSKKGDNFGFAKWVVDNAEGLSLLGPGRHYGEWWGSGIQRGYGVEAGQRYFSLFNVARWTEDPNAEQGQLLPPVPGLRTVPLMLEGRFNTGAGDPVNECLELLRQHGSYANPGFRNPEGIVVYHSAAKTLQKVLLENDDVAKGETA
jgi:hypothetical protein